MFTIQSVYMFVTISINYVEVVMDYSIEETVHPVMEHGTSGQ